jgi:6-phosphogluconolactonase
LNIHSFTDATAMADYATADILALAEQAIAQRGAFHLVLAGGTSPRQCYERLRQQAAAWQSWHIYFGDERCLPIGDEERNDTMAARTWLDHVAIPASQIHRMPTELGAKAAAASYNHTLSKVAAFDCVLLGMGEDGHTASLFPNNPALHAHDCAAVAVDHAPKPPAQRVSLTLERINQSHKRIIMVAGAGKQAVWKQIIAGESFPATAVDAPQWLYVKS